jgi:hypothetical protein
MSTGDFVSRGDSEEQMRILWTAAKLVLALVIVVPISIIALGLTLGLFGAVIGLAFVALRLAVVGLIAWGLFRLAVGLVGGRARDAQSEATPELRAPDPHYEAAMRELDRELGGTAR